MRDSLGDRSVGSCSVAASPALHSSISFRLRLDESCFCAGMARDALGRAERVLDPSPGQVDSLPPPTGADPASRVLPSAADPSHPLLSSARGSSRLAHFLFPGDGAEETSGSARSVPPRRETAQSSTACSDPPSFAPVSPESSSSSASSLRSHSRAGSLLTGSLVRTLSLSSSVRVDRHATSSVMGSMSFGFDPLSGGSNSVPSNPDDDSVNQAENQAGSLAAPSSPRSSSFASSSSALVVAPDGSAPGLLDEGSIASRMLGFRRVRALVTEDLFTFAEGEFARQLIQRRDRQFLALLLATEELPVTLWAPVARALLAARFPLLVRPPPHSAGVSEGMDVGVPA